MGRMRFGREGVRFVRPPSPRQDAWGLKTLSRRQDACGVDKNPQSTIPLMLSPVPVLRAMFVLMLKAAEAS
jgi:hypothetical protein